MSEPREHDVFQAFIRKLSGAVGLRNEDQRLLQSIRTAPRRVAAGEDISMQSASPSHVRFVVDGFAHRYKLLMDGKRQIVAVLVPGDFCDLHMAILDKMDHSIAALTNCMVMDIPHATIRDLMEHHPRIARALWWSTLVGDSTSREWITSLGRRQAAERLAYLFCELLFRLQEIGLADANSYAMPIRQLDLADMLGTTDVHLSRTLQVLRRTGLIELERRRLTIPDVVRLKAFCEFDPTYLHLSPRRPW